MQLGIILFLNLLFQSGLFEDGKMVTRYVWSYGFVQVWVNCVRGSHIITIIFIVNVYNLYNYIFLIK